MLSLTKKTDYALIAMSRLVADPEGVHSARRIAEDFGVPLPLLMNILKQLSASGIIRSTRGARGGYVLARPAEKITLADLIVALEGPMRLSQCSGRHGEGAGEGGCRLEESCPIQGPLQRVHERLREFLQNVTLAEIVSGRVEVMSVPGRGEAQ